ncbi:MAG: hypothetical protein ACFCBW_04180 [Candidatus Competibacterales bacterium]
MCDLSAAPPSRDPDSTISFAPRDSAPLEPNGGGCGRRRKLWELEPHCHCAVLGTCLPVKVLRQIYTQIQGEAPVHLSDYQIHSLFVKEASAPCAAIRRVHKALEARYRVAVQRFAKAKDEAELTALWEVAVVNEEEVAGAYWALMTHPRLSKILAARAFGDVHMLSHLAGRCRQRSARQQQQLERRCRELQSQLAERSTALCRLQRERHDERRTLEKAQQALREREATIAYLEAQLVALETTTELADLRRQLAAAERRAQWAEGRLAALASEVPPAVEAEPETISPPRCRSIPSPRHCPLAPPHRICVVAVFSTSAVARAAAPGSSAWWRPPTAAFSTTTAAGKTPRPGSGSF